MKLGTKTRKRVRTAETEDATKREWTVREIADYMNMHGRAPAPGKVLKVKP